MAGLSYFGLADAGNPQSQGVSVETDPAQRLKRRAAVSNEIFAKIDVTTKPATVPAGRQTKAETAEEPEVPTTADLPMLPEFRRRAEAIHWRAALSTAGLAAFLAAIAGAGCGAKATLRKPSPAIPVAGSTPTLSASSSRNFGSAGK